MKQSIKAFALLLLGCLLFPALVRAQEIPQLPTDPQVRIGKLPNGLTYYIRHNDRPKGQADFYIAQRVGSVLEEDNQRGLAHFLEHMCFNGTTHFPGKNLINWLESVGVKFGVNLNAYTSVDETVYNISNVPIAREGVQDSCLLILHDWANDLLLLPEEIDAERAVIHEEWRQSNVGQMRILEQVLPSIYPGERYGVRLPIGTMDVVDNFPHQALRDYYEKWYRPDQQGIIVVGDIDVDRIENVIKTMFSDIEMPENPAERIYFPVADTPGTIYAIGHDKEQHNSIVQLMIKCDALPRDYNNTAAYYSVKYLTSLATQILDTRYKDIYSKPNSPFAAADVYYGNFFLSKTKSALNLGVVADNSNQLPSALGAAYRELLRASRGGFTATEFERAKAELLSQYEAAYKAASTRENRQYVNLYVRNFIDNTPIPDAEINYEIYKQIAANVPLQALNQFMSQVVTADNRVVLALMPDNPEGVYPTEQQFAEALSAVDAEEIEAYKEELKSEPLIPQLPKPGTITKTEQNQQWNATVWTLSNGATVIAKPTKFKENEVQFTAFANNGTSGYGADYANSLTFLPTVLESYGLGTYTESDLQKYLAGKQASLNFDFGFYSRTLSGFSTPKDLPTLMELIYMGFTNVNVTPEEFEAMKATQISVMKNKETTPSYVFNDKIIKTLYHSPLIQQESIEVINNAQLAQILEVTKKMTENAADFTFIFVGNFEIDSLRPLVEQYIATLPSNQTTATRAYPTPDKELEMNPGVKTDTYTTPMETPQTFVYITAFGDYPYTMKNSQIVSAAGQILSKRLLDKVREEMGAVYSIGAYGSLNRIPGQNASIMTAFPMKPELKEETLKAIRQAMEDMTNEIDPAELDKVKEYLVKSYTENLERNGAWIGAIQGTLVNGVDSFNGNIESVGTITVDDVKSFMRQLLDQQNYRVVILDPAATAAEK